MKKLLLILTSLLLLSACSLPGVGSSPAASPKPTVGIRDGGPQTPKCAELEAQAASSPNLVVNGAWDCLTPEMKGLFTQVLHLTDDKGLATYAASEPSFTHYYSCDSNATVATGDWLYFDLRGNLKDSTMHYAIRMQVDSTGKVSTLEYAAGYINSKTC